MGKITKCPWGSFEVLSEAPDHKVKRIVVEPDGCLSLQLHHMRSEHWFVIAGFGVAIVDGKKENFLYYFFVLSLKTWYNYDKYSK